MPEKDQYNLPWKGDELRRRQWEMIEFKRYKMASGGYYDVKTEQDDAAAANMFGFKLVGIMYRPGVLKRA